MDAESQLLAEKDAEIARLKRIVASQKEALDRWSDEYQKLDEKLEQALRKNENQATLITKLADALENAWKTGAVNSGTPALIRRAWEATK